MKNLLDLGQVNTLHVWTVLQTFCKIEVRVFSQTLIFQVDFFGISANLGQKSPRSSRKLRHALVPHSQCNIVTVLYHFCRCWILFFFNHVWTSEVVHLLTSTAGCREVTTGVVVAMVPAAAAGFLPSLSLSATVYNQHWHKSQKHSRTFGLFLLDKKAELRGVACHMGSHMQYYLPPDTGEHAPP